ncbi:Uncharacterized protein DBV15_11642, partial [Temnothorax longispinosus]
VKARWRCVIGVNPGESGINLRQSNSTAAYTRQRIALQPRSRLEAVSERRARKRHEGMVSILSAEIECYSCLLRCGTERNHLFLAPLHTYLDTFAHYTYTGKEYQYLLLRGTKVSNRRPLRARIGEAAGLNFGEDGEPGQDENYRVLQECETLQDDGGAVAKTRARVTQINKNPTVLGWQRRIMKTLHAVFPCHVSRESASVARLRGFAVGCN